MLHSKQTNRNTLPNSKSYDLPNSVTVNRILLFLMATWEFYFLVKWHLNSDLFCWHWTTTIWKVFWYIFILNVVSVKCLDYKCSLITGNQRMRDLIINYQSNPAESSHPPSHSSCFHVSCSFYSLHISPNFCHPELEYQ